MTFEQLIGLAIIVGLVRLRNWLYWGRGRWIGVPIPDNVVRFRARPKEGQADGL